MAIVNMKDSRWLQLEVCREFQRNKCSRADTECKFAHPPTTVDVQNGRVVACYDSIKGRCNREKPPCKYFHPPQHLKDQLLINGRNHLALKNALMQSQIPHLPILGGQMSVVGPTDAVSPSAATSAAAAAAASVLAAATAAFSGPTRVHQVARLQRRKECTSRVAGLNPNDSYANLRKQASSSPYVSMSTVAPAAPAYGTYAPLTLIPGLMSAADQLMNYGVVHTPAALISAKGQPLQPPPGRSDRLEICREFQRGNCKRCETDCRFAHPPEHVQVDSTDGLVTVCMDFVKGRCSRDMCRYLHPPPHLQAQLKSRSMGVGGPAVQQQHQVDFAHQQHQQQQAQLFSLLPAAQQHMALSSAVRPATNPYRL